MSDDPPPSHSGNGYIDWAAAVGVHRRWLRTVVYSRLGDLHAVDEVLQDIALSAIERQPALDDPANVSAWLYRAAVLQSLQHRRKLGRQRRRMERVESNGRAESPVANDPLTWLLADEERQLVRRAVENLRSKDRELLLLKYTEHWTCRELAERLGISVTAVETRLDRAGTWTAASNFDPHGDDLTGNLNRRPMAP